MAIYTVQDTTMTALGDAIRKQIIRTTETVFSYPEIELWYGELYVIKLPSFAKKAKIVGKGYHKTWHGDSWMGAYQGLAIATGEYTISSSFYRAEDYQKVIDTNHYIDTPIEFEVIVNSNIFTLGATLINSNDENIVIIFDVIALDENGNEFKYTPAEMVEKIDGLITVPEKAFTITGNCQYRFAYGGNNWFIETAGDKITTKNISSINYMFYVNTSLETIPFDINMNPNSTESAYDVFSNCQKLTNIPMINNLKVPASGASRFFQYCQNIRNFPEGFADNWDFSQIKQSTYGGMASLFYACHSLRKAPQSIISNFTSKATSSYSSPYSETFRECYCLDEINGLGVSQATLTSNIFNNVVYLCSRLKDFTFAVNEDGTPKTANWKSQIITLSGYVGYVINESNVLNYNSGITSDKKVYDDATYQALKDDPDWYTLDINYSRYNHDSAVNTINSLPDCSSSGGTNTIKFTGSAGALTDGGAINTLTEEEIAVASAKGWTVSFV